MESLREYVQELIRQAERRRGTPISVRALSEALNVSYEHARRLAAGKPTVSRRLLERFATFLQVDVEPVWRRFEDARARSERRPTPTPTVSFDRLKRAWPRLTERQRRLVVGIAQEMAQLKEKPPGPGG